MKHGQFWTSASRPAFQLAGALCAALVGVGGCGNGDRADDAATEAGISRTARNGPVSLTLSASPAEVDFSPTAHLQVTIEVLAEAGVTLIDEPEGDVDNYDQMLREGDGRFEYRVERSGQTVAELAGEGKLRWRYLYELEFFLPGQYELPGVSAVFADMRGAGAAAVPEAEVEARSVTTDPLTIVVRPPADQAWSQEELTEIPVLSPVELPRRWGIWWWLGPLTAIVFAVAAGLMIRRARKRRTERVVIIPAHEWAQSQLAALIAEDLIGKGRIQEFYYRISAIVRGYIERRFGVCAPEMTTEEFLAVAASDPRFVAPLPQRKSSPLDERPHGGQSSAIAETLPSSRVAPAGGLFKGDGEAIATELKRFLTACDLVKYARHEPGLPECNAVLATAGEFVDRTRDGEPRALARADSESQDARRRHERPSTQERTP